MVISPLRILTPKLGMLPAWLLLTWYDSLEIYIEVPSASWISVFYYKNVCNDLSYEI